MAKKKKGSKSKSPKKKGGKKKGGKKKKGKKKKGKKKKAPKIDLETFDPTPFIDPVTEQLPLPLDMVFRIATRFGTSLEKVYQKYNADQGIFDTFFGHGNFSKILSGEVVEQDGENSKFSEDQKGEKTQEESKISHVGFFDLTALTSSVPGRKSTEVEEHLKPIVRSKVSPVKCSGVAYSSDSSYYSDDSYADSDFDDASNVPLGVVVSKAYTRMCEKSNTQVVTKILHSLRDESENLELNHGSLRSQGAIALFEALESAKSEIQAVVIRDNNIDAAAAPYMANFINESTHISEIDVGNNQLGVFRRSLIGATVPLARALGSSGTLHSVVISNNNLMDNFFKEFFSSLCASNNKLLSLLDISHNKMSIKSAGALADFLERSNGLTTLNLAWNNLRSEGGNVVMKALSYSPTYTPDLHTLNIDWNGIDDAVTEDIGTWLKQTNSLQNFTLANNNIGPKGMKIISQALVENFTIEYLDASFNPLGVDGTVAVIESVGKNMSLKVVRLIRTCDLSSTKDTSSPVAKLLQLRAKVITERELYTDIVLDFPSVDQGIFFVEPVPEEDEEEAIDEDENQITIYRSIWQDRCRDADAETFWDTESVLRRAFDSDWELSDTSSLIYNIDELEASQEIFARYYGTVFDLFRYYAATFGSQGKYLLLKKQGWQRFCQEMRLVDDDMMTVKSLMIMYGRCGGVPMQDNRSDAADEGGKKIAGLMRYEFLELLARCAFQKYNVKLKARKVAIELLRPSISIKTFMDNDILPHAFTTDHVGHYPGPSFFRGSDNFRDDRLYYEEVTVIFQKYFENLKLIFKHFARGDGSFTFETHNSMSLREWIHFCMESELCNDSFTRNDIALPFAYSIPCVVDELKSRSGDRIDDRTTLQSEIRFTDFLEALARTAEMSQAQTIADTKKLLSQKVETLLSRISEQYASIIEDDKQEEDHFAVEKDIEATRLQEEMDQLSLTFTPPDKDRFEQGVNNRANTKASVSPEVYKKHLLATIGTLCKKKIEANKIDHVVEAFPPFVVGYFLKTYGAGAYKKKLKEYLYGMATYSHENRLVDWFSAVIGVKSKYASDLSPKKGLLLNLRKYDRSLEPTFLGLLQWFLPLTHMVKRLESENTICSIGTIKNGIKDFIKDKKQRDKCIKDFKPLLNKAKQVDFSTALDVMLENILKYKDAPAEEKKGKKKKK